MIDLIWLNGEILPLDAARLSPASAGALYGWGVFTTLGVSEGRARAFGHHWDRLTTHAGRVGVPLERSREEIEAGLAELLRRGGVEEGRARVTVLRAGAGLWRTRPATESDVLIFASLRAPRDAKLLAVTVSPYRLSSSSPLAGVKCTAYVDHLIALEEARGRGFDEAIVLNERGEVVEATAANVFWIRDGELYTPSLATGCLAGITRRFVLEAASARRMRAHEGGFQLSALREADELFLTNSSWGVASVGEFDIHRYGTSPLAARLAAELAKALARPDA